MKSISSSYIRTLVCVLLLTISQFSRANEFPVSPVDEIPDGFRIFFPSTDRAFLPLPENDVDTTTEDSSRLRSSPKKKSVTTRESVQLLRFNALLRNGDRIFLIVNDLPCETVSDEASTLLTNPVGVSCRHLSQNQPLIKFQSDQNTLLVYNNKKLIATLLVGQSL